MANRPYSRSIDSSKKVNLAEAETDSPKGLGKEKALAELEHLGAELAELSNLLTYAGKHALLVILQGRDASGKDGSVRKILEFSNVLNASVVAFKPPTDEERAHDFLWRIHAATPRRGRTTLFNRSHYEDVVAVRVHDLAPKKVWKERYAQINAFERLLADSGVMIVKFFLNISRREQIQRLLEREKDPRTAWKLNVGDWRELPLWDQTTAAYEGAISKCATPEAPWHIVPADKKWFRNLAIIERLVLELRPHRQLWLDELKDMRKSALKEIRALRAHAKADVGL